MVFSVGKLSHQNCRMPKKISLDKCRPPSGQLYWRKTRGNATLFLIATYRACQAAISNAGKASGQAYAIYASLNRLGLIRYIHPIAFRQREKTYRLLRGGAIMTGNYKRIAIVTGATSGIGEATVRKFAAAGFGVIGNGRRAEKLAALETEIGSAFGGVVGNAADGAVLDRLFAVAEERFGRPADLVVANAGRGLGGSVMTSDLSQLGDVLNTNVTGTVTLLQKAAAIMAARQQRVFPESAADIVIIGSVVGRHISPFSAVYSATKFAVHALAESLRREVAPKGVRVSLVEPGIVVSGFQKTAGYGEEMVHSFHEKFGPLLTGDDIADAIHYIVSRPPHVHVGDILVRPTRQDYP